MMYQFPSNSGNMALSSIGISLSSWCVCLAMSGGVAGVKAVVYPIFAYS